MPDAPAAAAAASSAPSSPAPASSPAAAASPATERAPRAVLLAVFLASTAVLALELVQVRVFSYSIDPLLVYSAISVALLGLGAGGIVVALRPALARGEVRGRLAVTMAAAAAATLAVHAVFARGSEGVQFGTRRGVIAVALPLFALLVVPYLFAGVFLAVALARYVRDAGRVYAANLAGSALGCVAIYPVLRPLGAERLVALVAALAAWAGVCARRPDARGAARWAPLAVALAVTAAVPLGPRWFPFRPDPGDLYGVARAALARRYPGRPDRAYEPVREFDAWDPVSRVEVYAFPGEFGLVNGAAPVRLFAQDGGAGSMLIDARGQPEVARALFEGTVYAGAYLLRPAPARVLIIGLGGAPDVLAALHHHAGAITGVEINQSAIDAVGVAYARQLGGPYQRAGVAIVHRDGRSFVERTTERFDVIQITGADTYSAGAGGAFMFSESYLYTVEAFERYLAALTDGGVLSVIRFGLEPVRVVTTAVAALRARGVAHPARHVVVLGQGIWVNVLVSRSEISPARAGLLAAQVGTAVAATPRVRMPVYDALGFGLADPMGVLYAPGRPPASPYALLVMAAEAGRENELLAAAQPQMDFSPVPDDRPFFFQFLAPRHVGAVLRGGDEQNFYVRGLRAHLLFLLAIGAAAAALLVLPLLALRRRRASSEGSSEGSAEGTRAPSAAGPLACFAALGGGYLFVELWLMQKSALLLGHPTYSIATTLVTLLMASGLGSAWAGRRREAPRKLARGAALVVVALLAVLHVALPAVFRAALPWAFAARVAVLVAAVFPLGFAMGIPFPSALRAAGERGDAGLVAWGLGMNSFTSVVGSLVVVPLAMFGGFRVVTAMAAALYIAAWVSAPGGLTPRASGGRITAP